MTIDDKVKDKKLKDNINKEASKVSAVFLVKIEELWISYRWRNITSKSKSDYRPSQVYIFPSKKSLWKKTKKKRLKTKEKIKVNWSNFPKKAKK